MAIDLSIDPKVVVGRSIDILYYKMFNTSPGQLSAMSNVQVAEMILEWSRSLRNTNDIIRKNWQ